MPPFDFPGIADWLRPKLDSVNATVYNNSTSPKTTSSFAVQAGDVLVAFAFIQDGNGSSAGAISISDTASNSWTSQAEFGVGSATSVYERCLTATANATGFITVTGTRNSGLTSNFFGVEVHVWRHSAGVGAVTSANNGTGSGAPSVTITTQRGNSGLSCGTADWNATTGTDTWNNFAGNPTNQSDFSDGSTYGVHTVTYDNAGSAGDKTVSMSAPATQRYGIIAIEILAAP
jgi:hypothetical protein